MSGTSWGVAIAFDQSKTHKASRQWQATRRKSMPSASRPKGLTGAALDAAVLAIAVADPSLVKFQQAGEP